MAGFRPVVRARGFWSQAGWRDLNGACETVSELDQNDQSNPPTGTVLGR
jgi:hypothetical protein